MQYLAFVPFPARAWFCYSIRAGSNSVMSAAGPAIVLVHGAWHVPAHYETFTNLLTIAGFEVHCPLLPTCNGARPPNSSLVDDVNKIHSLTTSLLERGCRVVLLMRSYGGVVGTNAITSELYYHNRARQNLSGGVIGLVYMCAFFLQNGATVKQASKVGSADPVLVAEDGTSTVDDPRNLFYHDLPEDVAESCISLLVPHSIKAFVEPVTGAPWKHLPTSYFYTTDDRVLWLHWQREQVAAAREQGAQIREETFQSSHSPFVKASAEVTAAIRRTWDWLVPTCVKH